MYGKVLHDLAPAFLPSLICHHFLPCIVRSKEAELLAVPPQGHRRLLVCLGLFHLGADSPASWEPLSHRQPGTVLVLKLEVLHPGNPSGPGKPEQLVTLVAQSSSCFVAESAPAVAIT